VWEEKERENSLLSNINHSFPQGN